jgi:hypothetical protein
MREAYPDQQQSRLKKTTLLQHDDLPGPGAASRERAFEPKQKC